MLAVACMPCLCLCLCREGTMTGRASRRVGDGEDAEDSDMRGAFNGLSDNAEVVYRVYASSTLLQNLQSELLLASTLVQAGRPTCCTLRSPLPGSAVLGVERRAQAWHKANRNTERQTAACEREREREKQRSASLAALGLICTAHKAKTSHCPNRSWRPRVMDRGAADV